MESKERVDHGVGVERELPDAKEESGGRGDRRTSAHENRHGEQHQGRQKGGKGGRRNQGGDRGAPGGRPEPRRKVAEVARQDYPGHRDVGEREEKEPADPLRRPPSPFRRRRRQRAGFGRLRYLSYNRLWRSERSSARPSTYAA